MSAGSAPDTIVLVHGFWVTPRSWEHWISHYEAKGYTVVAPAYPGFEVEVEALNEDDTPDRGSARAGDHRELRERDQGAGLRADHHRPLCRRRVHAGASGPRLRQGRGGIELGPDRGGAGVAAVAGQVHVAGAQEPRQSPQGGRLHVRAVELRVHQRPARGPGAGDLRAVPHPRLGPDPVRQRDRKLHPRSAGHGGGLQERRPRPAAVRLGRRGPHHAAVDPAVEPQALQVGHRHRDHRVRGPAPDDRADGWEQIADDVLEWAVEHAR